MLQNINNQLSVDETELNTQKLLQDSIDNMVSDDYQDQVSKETQCMICYEEIDEINWIVFDCKHQMCIECLQKLYKYRGNKSINCPFCRYVVEKSINKHEFNENSICSRLCFNLSKNPIFCFIINLSIFCGCVLIISSSNHSHN